VPALLLAFALPMEYAAGTSLVVITLTSAVALAVRAGVGVAPDWGPVVVLTAVSAVGGFLGARLADRVDTNRLSTAFTVLVVAVAVYTATRALPPSPGPEPSASPINRHIAQPVTSRSSHV